MFKKLISSFKLNPVQNSVIIMLVVTVIFLGCNQFLNNGKGEADLSDHKSNTSTVAFFTGNPEDYYVPSRQNFEPVSGSKSEETLPVTTKSNTTKQIALKEGLYSYGNTAKNIASGIRLPDLVASNGLVNQAFAANRSYPVTYYYDISGKPKIIEINGLTGEKITVVEEENQISAINFSEKKQALLYSVSDNSDPTLQYGKTKVFYLNSKKTEILWDSYKGGSYSYSKWSPDGRFIISSIIYNDGARLNEGKSNLFLWVYDYENKTTIKYAWPEPESSSDRSFSFSTDLKWADDSKTLITQTLLYNKYGDNWVPFEGAATVDVTNGKFTQIDDGTKATPDGRRLGYLSMIGGKVYGLTRTPYNMTFNGMGDNGWLYVYDTATKTVKEFKDQMGHDTHYNFLVSSDGKRLVYVDCGDNWALKTLNTETGDVKKLSSNGSYLVPAGWNGNEENTLVVVGNIFFNVDIISGEVTRITN